MSNSDVKILRDELAKIIADNKKKDSVIEELIRIVEEGKKTTAELIMEIDMLRRRWIIYENPHAPPSNDSVPAQQKKARSARGAEPPEPAEGKTAGVPGRQNRPKERRLEFRAASPVMPASPTTGDLRRSDDAQDRRQAFADVDETASRENVRDC